jgi:SAM-dependent methyltransferase
MMSPSMHLAVNIAVGAAAGLVIVSQCRKPSWLPGQLFVRSMNTGHTGLTTWGLSQVSIKPDDTILDVGCGGGKTISRMAKAAERGRVFGVDYSATSVSVARRVNAAAIDAGRVDVQLGSVSALPFPDETFDLVTAVETHYYWPNIQNDLRELQRVLKPSGRVVLIAETYRGRRGDWLYRPVMRLLGAAARGVWVCTGPGVGRALEGLAVRRREQACRRAGFFSRKRLTPSNEPEAPCRNTRDRNVLGRAWDHSRVRCQRVA